MVNILSVVASIGLVGFVSSEVDIPLDLSISEAEESTRGLQFAQEIRWNITDPDFAYIDHEFILEWKTSDFIQDRMVKYTIYDGWDCGEGSNDITDQLAAYANNNVYFAHLGLQPDSNTPPNSGLGYRDFRLFLAVQPTAAESPIFYYTDNGGGLMGRMDFCVRFSLYNEDPDEPNSVEVNFQETLVAFYADLTDGFNVTDVTVTSKNKIEKDAYVKCEIEAYECDRQNQPLANPGYLRNQGREVRVCVELTDESKAEGLYLDRIIWFYFIRTHEDGDIVRQNAIIPDSLPALSGLTDYECMRGVDVCPFDTILRADFFAWSGVGIVRGIGEGLCQFGGSPYLVEDVPKVIGDRLGWKYHIHAVSYATRVNVTGFPVGSTISYTDTDLSDVSLTITSEDYAMILEAPNDARLRSSLDSLQMTAPLHSDEDFSLSVLVRTSAGQDHLYLENVPVLAVADPPSVWATALLVLDEGGTPLQLQVNPDRSEDEDNSESLSVTVSVPQGEDGLGPVGTIEVTSDLANVDVSGAGTSSIRVTSVAETPAEREALLDTFLDTKIAFQPRAYWSGVLTGNSGIRVAAISTEASGQVAPANSIEEGTYGDLDTRTEEAVTYVDITVNPVNDLPYLTNTQSIHQENKLEVDFDADLEILIGQEMGVVCDDVDGSQSLQAEITGFPTNALALSFWTSIEGVNVTTDIADGAATIAGDNVVTVLKVLESLRITLAHDDDRNFLVEIDGVSTDSNGAMAVSGQFHLEHQVIVQAVADTPSLDVGSQVKPFASEDAGLSHYPVTIGLNDIDGSETYQGQEVQITFSTPTTIATGADPVFDFGNATAVVVTEGTGSVTPGTGSLTLSGTGPELEAAMESMMIRAGDHNGENITVTVTVTSLESNPSELGPGEVAIPIVTSVETFEVPIEPRIQGEPTLTVPTNATGLEDSKIDVGTVETGLDGIEDTDGSEIYYLEIRRSSYPARTKFFVDGSRDRGTSVGEWLRLANPSSKFEVRPPPNFSGVITLSVRGRITDYAVHTQVTKATGAQDLPIFVSPVADPISEPSPTVGVEDLGPVSFGATLANSMAPTDNGSGNGNNPETETISQVQFQIPADGDVTYTLSGTYAPTEAGAGTVSGSGTAEIAHSGTTAETRTYTITSSIITGAADIAAIPQAEREAAEQDIRDTLATFLVELGPEHTDSNGLITVTTTTLDVNIQEYDTRDQTFAHTIRIQAVADAGGVFTHSPVIVYEDGDNIPLVIDVTRSDDDDNSERMSVRITVPSDGYAVAGAIVGSPPAGVQLTDKGNGSFLVTADGETPAAREAALNSFTGTGEMAFDPRANFAGNITLRVDVIMTEAASGDEVAGPEFGGADGDSKTETVTDYITLSVIPVADNPTLEVKANAVGGEDTKISIPIGVSLTDNDGSETYVMEVASESVPQGSRIFGLNDQEILPAGGIYSLQPADVDNLKILPPLHYSSEYQGDMSLQTTIIVTDSTSGYENVLRAEHDIPVQVNEISDPPNTRIVTVVATEDVDYPIGQYVGDLDGVLVDDDGSEKLSLVVGGLPPGVVAKTAGMAGISYIGDGEWQVDADMVPSLTISSKHNFGGNDPYKDITFRAVSQEVQGHESSTDWDVTFEVYPVADGFSSWSPGVKVTEAENEVQGLGVSLSDTGSGTLADPDSEYVVRYFFDMSNMIADAGIAKRLVDLTGVNGAGLDALIANGYLEGTYTYDSPSGTVTVESDDIATIKLKADLFLDSNQNFDIPVSALVHDTVTINGADVTVDKTDYSVFKVTLKGTADVPVLTADSVAGDCKIRANFGGTITDTDISLGRSQSESIWFIVESVNPGGLPGWSLVDVGDNVVGYDGGAGTWILTEDDILTAEASGGLYFSTQPSAYIEPNTRRTLAEVGSTPSPVTLAPTPSPTPAPTVTASSEPTTAPSQVPTATHSSSPTVTAAEFNFISIVSENDGDSRTDSVPFTVLFWDQSNGVDTGCGGVNPIPPLVPDVVVGDHNGFEDTQMPLNITVAPKAEDITNPTVSIIISQWPEGSSFTGDFRYNHATGAYVASAAVFNGGEFIFNPPPDAAGFFEITVEVIAVNAWYLEASTGEFNIPLYFDPVADGPAIGLGNLAGQEDATTSLPITLELQDTDGSEILGANAYVQVCENAALNGNYPVVASTDSDATIDGIVVEGYHRIPVGETSTLSMEQDQHWHGDCPVSVVGQTIETQDDPVPLYRTNSTEVTFPVYINAVANPPIITAPGAVSGDEDTYIPIPGLSITRVDTVFEPGFEEVLSTTFSNLPEGTQFNHGINGGNGIWTIPIEKLDDLEISPPEHFAGTFDMIFTGYSKEVDNGHELSVSETVQVTVAPVADNFFVLALDVSLEIGGAPQVLPLNVRMDDTRGDTGNEVDEEVISVTFTSVPSDMTLTATLGGSLTLDAGVWTFVGTEAQSNAISVGDNGLASIGSHLIGVSFYTIDGASVWSPPKTDTFRINVVDAGASESRALQGLDLNVGGVFDVGVQGIRHCDSNAKFLWDSDEGSYVRPQVSVTKQSHTSVSFSLAPGSAGANWMAVLFPLAPAGDNSCPVPALGSGATTYTANCYDYLATAYVYVNVDDAPEDLVNVYVPKTCDVPDSEDGGSKTIIYAVSIPCSPCTGDDDEQVGSPGTDAGGDNPTRRRELISDTTINEGSQPRHKPSLYDSEGHFLMEEIYPLMKGPPHDMLLNALFEPRRRLEEEIEGGESLLGPANRVELEILAVGDDNLAAASGGVSSRASMFMSAGLALMAASSLLFALF